MLKDLKEGLSSSRKADTTHMRRSFQIYTCRPCEYGSDKYERANFMRRLHDGAEPTAADFERFRKYLRAARDHIDECLESMERHQSQDPKLADVNGMKMAAYAIDTDVTPGSKIGASRLPHVAPACASLMMAITQATDCGLLPKDPGTPWRNAVVAKDEHPADAPRAAIAKTRDSNGFDNDPSVFKVGDRVVVRCPTSLFNNRIGTIDTIGKISDGNVVIGEYLVEFRGGAGWLHKRNLEHVSSAALRPDGSYATMDEAIAASVEYLKKLPEVDVQKIPGSLQEALENTTIADLPFPKRREPNQ